MTDTHGSGEHHGPGVQAYMVVFGALAVFTAISFVVNWALGQNTTSMLIILAVAVVKAILVGLYFMHLVVDWGRLYYLIFPTFILAAMFITVLLPDIVLVWPSKAPPTNPPVGIAAPHTPGEAK
jgi:cytochrome c oxidase subunit 4